MAIDAAWVALVGTLCGGIGLKIADHYLGKNKVKSDDATQIRDELRLEINSQREEIRHLEADAVKWKDDYYDLRDKYVALQTELTLTLENIRTQAIEAKEKAVELESRPPETPSP